MVTITTAILYLQRLSCWLLSRQDRPPWHAVVVEPLLTGLMGTLSFLLALRRLFL